MGQCRGAVGGARLWATPPALPAAAAAGCRLLLPTLAAGKQVGPWLPRAASLVCHGAPTHVHAPALPTLQCLSLAQLPPSQRNQGNLDCAFDMGPSPNCPTTNTFNQSA